MFENYGSVDHVLCFLNVASTFHIDISQNQDLNVKDTSKDVGLNGMKRLN